MPSLSDPCATPSMGFNFAVEGTNDESNSPGAGIFGLFGGTSLPSQPQAESPSEFSFSFGGGPSAKDDNNQAPASNAFSLF